MKTLSSLIAGP